jgi:hypothetical protein
VKSMAELQQERARREPKPLPKPTLRPSDATNLAGTETGRQHLSHTRIGVLQACHRKYELSYEKRLERIDRVESLEMGKAFHKGIELRRPEAAGAEIMLHADEAPSSGDYDKLKIQAAVVMAATELYLRRWVPKCLACAGLGAATVPDGYGNFDPCVLCEGAGFAEDDETREMEYLVRLRNPWTGHYSNTFDLKGYADGVVEAGKRPCPDCNQPTTGPFTGENKYGPLSASGAPCPTCGWKSGVPVTQRFVNDAHLELMEAKLVGQITNTQIRKLVLDRQVTLASYGLWRATGKPVAKIHYRYVKKPQIRQRQGESVQQFCDRIIADYRSRPDFYSHEETLFRTTEDMLRVECELWTWAEQLRALRRQRIYDRNVSSCDMYGQCQFLEICTGEPDAMALYRVREPS